VGTSGFVYRHWRGVLYPEKLPQRLWLTRYSTVFSTVELNTTFYRLPKAEAVDRWRDETPPGFLFACKGSRYLTHLKRLTEVGQGLDRFFSLVRRLKEQLGPALWQIPPQMSKADPARLQRFVDHLPSDIQHAFEFRSEAWYTAEICDILDSRGVAFCEHDLVDKRPPRTTGQFRYLRFHGRTGKYSGRYGRRGLAPHAQSLDAWRRRGLDAYVYFNNDVGGHAVRDAIDLTQLLGETPPLELHL